MNKKLKQLLKKHVDTIKSMYPEVYIEIEMDGDEIFIGIDSLKISNEVKYETLLGDFYEEYYSKGFGNIFWGVDSTLTNDNLHLLEDFVKTPKKEKIIEYPITQKQFARR
ncbi:MAG: hypothetical protein FWH53_01720 [Leptospirales bacterium]|nr:hypothetical protein [Leptospirales bacterium]